MKVKCYKQEGTLLNDSQALNNAEKIPSKARMSFLKNHQKIGGSLIV